MLKRVSIHLLALGLLSFCAEADQGLPPGFQIAPNTVSPGGHYAFSAPVDEIASSGDVDSIHNSLMDAQKGKPLATVLGVPGFIHAYEGGILNPWWAKDESAVAWSCINRRFQGSLVILKIKAGKVEWQVDVLRACQNEIESRLKDYYLLHKKSWPEDALGNYRVEVNTIPNFFSGQTVDPLTLPLKFRVHASPSGSSPEADASLDGEVELDGTIKFGAFRVFKE